MECTTKSEKIKLKSEAMKLKGEELKVIDMQLAQLKRKRDESSDETMVERYGCGIKVLEEKYDKILLGEDDEEIE